MNPTVKKFILFTVGAVSLTKEKFDEFVSQLESEGALNKDEGEQLVKDFLSESDKRTREFASMVDKEVRRVMAEMNKDNKGAGASSEGGEAKEDDMHNCKCGKHHDMENCDCDEDCDCEECQK